MNVYVSFARTSEPEARLLQELIKGLGLHTWDFWDYEYGSAGYVDRNMYKTIHDEVYRADIFIGVYAHWYGWVPEKDWFGPGTTDGETSIFRMEYQWALERNIPMLFYFLADKDEQGQPLPVPEEMRETDPVRVKKLNLFKEEIRKKYVFMSYASLPHLKKLAGASLLRTVHRLRFGLEQLSELLFISHSTKDDEFVNRLVDRLQAAKLQSWVDHQHMLSGADWDTTLECALDAANSLIVVITPNANQSLVVKAEWSYFGETGRRIYPILLEGSEVPFRLRVLQYTDFRKSPDQAFGRLLESFGLKPDLVPWSPEG